MRYPLAALAAVTATTAFLALAPAGAQEDAVFKAGVDIVDVAATVTDGDGRFIRGLTKDDFTVYEDGKPQEIVSFSSERVPVSLAMLLDVSGSMSPDQLDTARLAIKHFIFDLLDKDDELFLMEFAGRGRILQQWTRDRERFSQALARTNQEALQPFASAQTIPPQNYGTAVYDAVATSLRYAARGANRKKAVLVITDGIDTSSRRTIKQVQEAIRATEILVYALGVDPGSSGIFGVNDGVDTRGLRKLTDDTGGRTEVVKGFKNLDKATARLADEFNQQYVLGYAAPNHDGRWHAIKVQVRKKGSKVRTRAGYTAS